MSTTHPPVTQIGQARVVWVESTTVGSERNRLSTRLSKARGVFGTYAERSQPSVQRIVDDLRDLAGQPDHATLIPVPPVFGATPASKLLPRGARVVGWLDTDGYRSVTDTPQPGRDWLQAEHARLH